MNDMSKKEQLEMAKGTIEKNLIASWGVGLNQVAFSALEYGRYTVAWGCVGIAEQSIYLACKYANDRIQFHRKI